MTGGIERELPASVPLRLEAADGVWILSRGSGALFAHTGRDDRLGPRRFVCTLAAGDVLFGLPSSHREAATLVLVPHEASAVIEIIDWASAKDAGADPAALFERWRARVWPLVATTAPSSDSGAALAERIRGLQVAIVDRLAALDRVEDDRETAQLSRRRTLARLGAHRVFGQMVSTVLGAPASEPTGDSPVLAALQTVAAAQGLRIVAPGHTETFERVDEELDAIVRVSRVRTRRVLLEGQWWRREHGPLLVFSLDGGRPSALLPLSGRGCELIDPLDGQRVRVDAAIASTLAPVAVMVYPRLPDGVFGPLTLLRFALVNRYRDLTIALLCAVVATLLNMVWPAAVGLIVDSAIPDGDRALLLQLVLGLFAAAIGRTLFDVTQSVALTRIQISTAARAQPAIWDRVLNLKLSVLRQYSTGDLQARVGIINAMSSALGGVALRTVLTGALSLLNLVAMIVYSPALTGLVLAIGALLAAVTITAGRATLRISRQLQAMAGQTFGLTVQLVNAVAKLHVAGAESRAFAQWGELYTREQTLTRDGQRVQDRVTVFNLVLPTLTAAVLFAVSGQLLASPTGGLSAGAFLAFNALAGTFSAAASALSNTVIETLDLGSLWDRAKPLIAAEVEVDQGKTHPGRLRGAVDVANVRFRYRPDGPLILSDATIRAVPGEFIALVGASGSGKSTLMRLLLGFASPESGAVLLDGQDLSGLDVHAVRRQYGVVLQSSRLIAGSLFENIAAGSAITLSQALEALRKAGLEDDVNALPMGIHTYISEGGSNLSGGQRQRVLIARALVHTPAVLLFDEATSALDNHTQAIVSQSLEALGVTRIVIAHRLSTIRKANRIYVIDRGRVVQIGSFAELAAQDGLFRQLMARQTM